MKSLSTNTMIIVAAALIVAAGAYWYFFTGTGNEPPLSTDTTLNPAQAQFQTLTSQLQPVTFDTSIFSDPRFNALVDIATPVTPETPGRLDPFALVPGVAGK